jgi:hypothetical protein
MLIHMDSITTLKRLRDKIDTSLAARPQSIRQARTDGHTWPEISQALGVTRQTAITLSKIGSKGPKNMPTAQSH